MMRRLLLATFALLLPALAHAQGTVTLTANSLRMGGGSTAVGTGAQFCVMTVDANNRPAGYRVGVAGQTIAAVGGRECHPITNGTVQPFQVINSANSSPANACIRVTTEAANGVVLRSDPCVQTGTPDSLANGFCTSVSGTVTCNYDAYDSGTAPVALTLQGAQGQQGPPGCVVGSTCSSSLTPQKLGGVSFADSYSGSDLSAQIAAAFAANAGTSTTPAVSAEVDLSPNTVYTYSSPIEIPHSTSAPYISNPVLDCKGALLLYTGNTSAPAVLVRGQNANNSGQSPRMRNCYVSRNDSNGPVLLNKDRMGFLLTDSQLYGGNDSYAVQLTTSDGGPGYLEQSLLQNVSMVLPSANGIHVTWDGTGTGGYQYNRGYNLRFEFAAGTHNQIFIENTTGSGQIFAANGDYSTLVNTNGAGTMYIMRASLGASIVSTRIVHNGEATSGGALFRFGGGGLVSLECTNLMRTNIVYDYFAHCSGSKVRVDTGGPLGGFEGSVTRMGEGSQKNASATMNSGDQWVRLLAVPVGNTTFGLDQWMSCPTTDPQPEVWASTTCLNELFHRGRGGWGFGSGWNDSSTSSTLTVPHTITVHGSYGSNVPSTTNDEYTQWEQRTIGGVPNTWVLVHYRTMVASTTGQPSAPEIWDYYDAHGGSGYSDGPMVNARGDGHVDSKLNGNTDSSSFSVGGTAGWSGTCTPPKSTIVSNGIVTACN